MATKVTLDAVRAICSTDPSITAAQMKAALLELDGEGIREMIQRDPPRRAYSRKQVAALLGVSTHTVSNYAQRGYLTPILSGSKMKRAQSYTGESVEALLAGMHLGGKGRT